MIIKKILSYLSLGLLLSTLTPLMPIAAQPEQAGLPFALSEEEMQNLAQELDQFFNSLTPEQQEEFMKEVERETEKMSKMSPEELDQYVQQTLFEEMPEEEAVPEQPVAAEPEIEDDEDIPVQPAQPEEKTAQQKKEFNAADITSAVALLSDLAEDIDTFLLKTEALTGFDGKVESWLRTGKLRPWTDTADWKSLKKEIESLKQHIVKLKEQDRKTGDYYHIKNLLQKEKLYKSLNKLHADLVYYNPRIRITTDMAKPLSQSSKEAIRVIINTCAEKLFDETVITRIQEVIKQFDPEAQKIAQEEKTLRKKAERTGARTGRPDAPVIGGRQERYGDFYQPQEYYEPEYYPYDGSNYSPDTYFGPQSAPVYQPDTSTGSAAPSAPTATQKKQPSDSTKTDPKKDKKTEDKKKKEEKPLKKDTTLDRYLRQIEDTFEYASDQIEEHKNFRKLKDHMLKGTNPDYGLIKRAGKVLKNAERLTNKLNSFESRLKRLKSADQRAGYREKLRVTVKDYYKLIRSVRMQVNEVEQKKNKVNKKLISAYFADLDKQDTKKKEEEPTEKTMNIVELKTAIDSLFEKAEKIVKEKLTV